MGSDIVTVLTTIDRDPGCTKVVETAEDLSAGLGQELVILHVKSESEDDAAVRAEIEEIAANAVRDDTNYEVRIVEEAAKQEAPTGRTASTILRVTEEIDPSYLVIGSRKRTTVGKVLLGSVSQLVLRNAEVPVVTVEQAT